MIVIVTILNIFHHNASRRSNNIYIIIYSVYIHTMNCNFSSFLLYPCTQYLRHQYQFNMPNFKIQRIRSTFSRLFFIFSFLSLPLTKTISKCTLFDHFWYTLYIQCILIYMLNYCLNEDQWCEGWKVKYLLIWLVCVPNRTIDDGWKAVLNIYL